MLTRENNLWEREIAMSNSWVKYKGRRPLRFLVSFLRGSEKLNDSQWGVDSRGATCAKVRMENLFKGFTTSCSEKSGEAKTTPAQNLLKFCVK